jgi:hypothetical protein
MSFEREMSRGRFLKERFGVNGSQKAARSFGTSARKAALALAAVVIEGGSFFKRGVGLRRTMPAGPALVQFDKGSVRRAMAASAIGQPSSVVERRARSLRAGGTPDEPAKGQELVGVRGEYRLWRRLSL